MKLVLGLIIPFRNP